MTFCIFLKMFNAIFIARNKELELDIIGIDVMIPFRDLFINTDPCYFLKERIKGGLF